MIVKKSILIMVLFPIWALPTALSKLNFRVTLFWIGRFDDPFRGGLP